MALCSLSVFLRLLISNQGASLAACRRNCKLATQRTGTTEPAWHRNSRKRRSESRSLLKVLKAVHRLDAHHGSDSGLMGKNKNRNQRQNGSPPGSDGYRLVGGRPNTSNDGRGNGANGGQQHFDLAKQLQQLIQQQMGGRSKQGRNYGQSGNGSGKWKPRWTREEWAAYNKLQEENKAKLGKDQEVPKAGDSGDSPDPAGVEANDETKVIRERVQSLQRFKESCWRQPGFDPELAAKLDTYHATERIALQKSKPPAHYKALLETKVSQQKTRLEKLVAKGEAEDKAVAQALEAQKLGREKVEEARAGLIQLESDLAAAALGVSPSVDSSSELLPQQDPAIAGLAATFSDVPEVVAALKLLSTVVATAKETAAKKAADAAAQLVVDNEGDTGMAGDSQVAATPSQPVAGAEPAETSTAATEVTTGHAELATMRAAMEQAAAQAAEAKARLEEQLQGQSARDAEMLQLRQQLEAATNPTAIVETTAGTATEADDPPRGNQARDSRSRSAERKRRAKTTPVLHR